MIKKIAFVSHRSKDMDADRKFWGELLGLKQTSDYEGKWIEFETPDGKTIAIEQFSPEGTPPMLSLETDNIEAEVAHLRESGATIKGDITDNKVCKMAFVLDPSGNMVMLHQISPDRA